MIIKFINEFLFFILNTLFPETDVQKKLRSIDIQYLYETVEKNTDNKYEDIYSIFNYKDPFIKNVIWEMKYNGNKYAFELCGEILYEEIISYIDGPCLLIPIPISKERLKERGFNQSEKLCEVIKRKDEDDVLIYRKDLLFRKINTKSQTKMKNKEGRFENMKNVFDCKEKIKNKKVILIDDVCSTGATIKSAGKTLKKYGANEVYAFTMAH